MFSIAHWQFNTIMGWCRPSGVGTESILRGKASSMSEGSGGGVLGRGGIAVSVIHTGLAV